MRLENGSFHVFGVRLLKMLIHFYCPIQMTRKSYVGNANNENSKLIFQLTSATIRYTFLVTNYTQHKLTTFFYCYCCIHYVLFSRHTHVCTPVWWTSSELELWFLVAICTYMRQMPECILSACVNLIKCVMGSENFPVTRRISSVVCWGCLSECVIHKSL